MTRLPRPDIADIAQHVVQRGNNRMPCFLDDEDRRRYLHVLRQAMHRYECELHAYVLMSNHVHLLLTPSRIGAVSRLMQTFGRNYAHLFNARHQRSGTLWEGRYKSCLVDTEDYVLRCYRYIELNPVRAWMVADPSLYPWSSHLANLGRREDPLLTLHPAFRSLGSDSASRSEAYQRLFREALSESDIAEIRIYLQQQRALGSSRFQQRVAAQLERYAAVRPAHRPRKPL